MKSREILTVTVLREIENQSNICIHYVVQEQNFDNFMEFHLVSLISF